MFLTFVMRVNIFKGLQPVLKLKYKGCMKFLNTLTYAVPKKQNVICEENVSSELRHIRIQDHVDPDEAAHYELSYLDLCC